MRYSACVIVQNIVGRILAVSRKDDLTDFGLPGGKVEPHESIKEAAIRECLEETGYSINIVKTKSFVDFDGKFEVTTFLATIDENKPQINTCNTETGLVEWVRPVSLLKGTFAEYNLKALKHFGIIKKYQMWYSGNLNHVSSDDVDDIVYSTSCSKAITEFVCRNKGKFLVHECKEIKS